MNLSVLRSGYECFQIKLAQNYGRTVWRADIKSLMLNAGLQNKQITFLFVDTQVNIANIALSYHQLQQLWFDSIIGIQSFLFLAETMSKVMNPSKNRRISLYCLHVDPTD